MMRRDVLKSFGALLVTSLAMARGIVAGVHHEVWGPMDVYRHRALMNRGIHLHIYHFNQDVTKRCRFFDDTPGYERAELFLHNSEGHAYLNADRTGAAIEVITNFVIRRGEPLCRA